MEFNEEARVKPRTYPSLICTLCTLFAIAGGAVSLAAWVMHIPQLGDWWNSGIHVKANTAIALTGAGFSLLLVPTDRRAHSRAHVRALIAQLFAAVPCTLGSLTLFEHISDIDLGIDTLFFFEPSGMRATAAPGRMGPPASTSLMLLGAALILLHRGARARALSAGLALFTLGVSALSLTGFWYGAEAMYTLPRLTGISPQTALILAALSIGMLAALPERQPVKTLLADSSAGLLGRRLLLVAVPVPLILGWLRLHGTRINLFDDAFGTALRSLAEIIVLCLILWWSMQAIRVREIKQRRAESERRASERRLRRTLLEADQRKDEFLATLAHELRNPLAPIRNATSVILLRAQRDEPLRVSAEIIDRQVRHMVRLLEDLLDISRISRSRLDLRKQPVELATILHNAIEASRPAIDGAEHRLDIELPAQPVVLEGDEVRLTQVFSNLLNNAAHYTPRAGHIRIAAVLEADEVIVRVSDDGIGISDEELPRIFQAFTQADAISPNAHKGLGIGLSLVRGIVELHGGKVDARSAGPGRGSEFIVRLPVAKTAAARSAHATDTTPATGALRLLVVDDMQDNANTMATLLRALGHEVSTAYTGLSALEIACRERFDVIFLDIGMPDLDGIAVCSGIRASRGHDVRIVAITGWGQERDRQRTLGAGFDAHLVKPVDISEILRLLGSVEKSAANARQLL